jgi:Fic family protein
MGIELEFEMDMDMNTSKYAKLAKCSNDTALRDIQELKTVGVLIQNTGVGAVQVTG